MAKSYEEAVQQAKKEPKAALPLIRFYMIPRTGKIRVETEDGREVGYFVPEAINAGRLDMYLRDVNEPVRVPDIVPKT